MSISDDDLNINADIGDRPGSSSSTVNVSGVRGGKAILSVFNKDNKLRLIFFGAVAVLVVVALFMAFVGFEEPIAPTSKAASVNSSGRVPSADNEGPGSFMQQQNVERYNDEVLPVLQKSVPTAHPLLETNPDGNYQVEEVDLNQNPFPVETETKARNITENVGINQHQQSSRNAPPVIDPKLVDSVITSLIEAEGAARVPRASVVSWTYAKPAELETPAIPTVGDGSSKSNIESGQNQCPPYIVRAGDMELATTDLAMNSDVLGPVAITLRSGKFRNARLIGEFERADTWLRIRLKRMVYGDKTYDIDAIALDTETTLNAVEGDVNRHIMYRYGWWGFGTVLKAIGKGAELNADSQTFVTDGAIVQDTQSDSEREVKIMLGQLGQDMGDVMQDRLNRPITVSLNVGDEVGVFFLDDLCAADK